MTNTIFSDEFPHLDNLIYLNHAAVAPWPLRTANAIKEFTDQNLQLGAKHYPRWLGIELRLRQKLARLINAPSTDDIALVKNTSEALSLVAYGLDWQAGQNIVTSNQEFPSNRVVWESLSQYGVELRQADLTNAATPEQALMDQVDDNTRLLSISSVEYASGLRIDLQKLGAFCRQRDILFCVDAIQSIGALPFDVQQIEADFVMADGHKWMLAPEGLALFYCRADARPLLKVLQYGWHMLDPLGDYDSTEWSIAKTARRFECGSPNMLAIHALESSIGLLLEVGLEQIEKLLLQRSAHLINAIKQHPKLCLITSPDSQRHAGIITFKAEGVDHQALYKFLMDNDVICAYRGGGIRFSPNFYTPLEQLDQALQMVDKFIG